MVEVSAARITGLWAEGDTIVKDRGFGGAMAQYISKNQKRRPDLKESYDAILKTATLIKESTDNDKLAEDIHNKNRQMLRVAVFEDVADNVQGLIDRFSNMSSDELLENYEEFVALHNICDTPNTLVYLRKTVGKEKIDGLLQKIDPLTSLTDRLLAKMNILASPLGHMVDPDQLLKLSGTQINTLNTATAHIFDIGSQPGKSVADIATENANYAAHNIFSALGIGLANTPIDTELQHKVKASMGIDITTSNVAEPLRAYDLFGNPVNDAIHTCQSEGIPVFFASEKHPEKYPVLAFVRDGKTYVGDEALRAYQAQANAPSFEYPQEPAPYNPASFSPHGTRSSNFSTSQVPACSMSRRRMTTLAPTMRFRKKTAYCVDSIIRNKPQGPCRIRQTP